MAARQFVEGLPERTAVSGVPPGTDPDTVARRLLEMIRELALSLHPHRQRALRVSLDSSLDADLGFDSLGRVELLLRIERAFRVHLPESLLAEAETPGDLLRALLTQSGAEPSRLQIAPVIVGAVESIPPDVKTLVAALEWHYEAHPDRPHVFLDNGTKTVAIISYRNLRDASRKVAAGLHRRGIVPGTSVAIMLPTGTDYFSAFFGILYAGGVPVPIYPPFRPAQLEDHLRHQAGIIGNAQAALLITDPAWHTVTTLLLNQLAGSCKAATLDMLSIYDEEPPGFTPLAQHTALIQYTSGSTGDPKGVVLSHANLLANIRAMGVAIEVSSSDMFVSWLPLYHDMGLIGAWLGALYHAFPTAIMPPVQFLRRPENWLWAIHRYRASLSAAPNFAYELCLRNIEDTDIKGLDLSSVRLLMNGAENVSPKTVRQFSARFSAHGLKKNTIMPAYGLAECALGLTASTLGRGPRIDRVQRQAMVDQGLAVPAGADAVAALEFVACGHALTGYQIRILDEMGHELDDRREGRLQFRGPSATRGYFNNPAKTRALFDGEWLESGDLAYSAEGDIFITGRSKDIVIRAGRHIYPEEVEKAVGEIAGVRTGCVAVFGAADPQAGTERVVIVAETSETEPAARERIRQRINETVTMLLEAPADDIVLAAPNTVLKTSSGKIRRAACRELYERGMGSAPPPMWLQKLRLQSKGIGQRLLRAGRELKAVCYAIWWWSIVAIFATFVWTMVVLLPTRRARWNVVHAAARASLWTLGIHLDVTAPEPLPVGGTIAVANHSSYLDSVVLCAVLRRSPVFVAKQELAAQFVAGTLLGRIGTLFVERTQIEKGTEATERAIAAARAGELLVFFPEGTLTRMPGLLSFRMGPFLAAAEAGVPVVPVTIRGTRAVLRGDQWFPRHGAVRVHIATPIAPPAGSRWNQALALRDAARAAILRQVGEPDLAEERIQL